jgi:hypothetical protein
MLPVLPVWSALDRELLLERRDDLRDDLRPERRPR